METQTETGTTKRRRTRGRIDKDSQEAVITLDPIKEKIDYLVKLYKAQEDASKDFGDAVKAISEKCGLNAGPVRKYVIARAGDDFEKAQKQVVQLALLFED